MSINTEYIPDSTPSLHEYQSDPKGSKLESSAFYIFLTTVVFAPIAFLPTPYIAIEAVKTLLIAIGTLVSAVLYGVIAYKEKKIALPPRGVLCTGVLVVASLVASSLASSHVAKSFFGQGFELTTASFLIILILAGFVAFTTVRSKAERVTILYVGMIVSFLVLAILHGLRFIFGASFLSLGVLSSVTTTIMGSWYDIAAYAVVIALVVISALVFLPLSRRMKIVYGILLAIASVAAVLINSVFVWVSASVVFAGLTIYLTVIRPKPAGNIINSSLKRMAWLPLIACVFVVLFFWKGTEITGTIITKIGAEYTTLSLPWQISLDIAAGSIKDRPILGVGPNNFGKAYIAYKPISVNNTYAWNAEFNYAVSLLATFVATQGIFGIISWGLFVILLILAGAHALRRLPTDPYARFAVVSSSASALFLWILIVVSVPSHVLLLYAYVLTAIAIGTAVNNGSLDAYTFVPRVGSRSQTILGWSIMVLIVIGAIWGVAYLKNAVALAYFGSGVKTLTVSGDPIFADTSFATAQRFNASDIYLRARVEAGITRANQLIAQANAASTGTTSQALIVQIGDSITASVKYAQAAIAYDQTNYYNYVSEARVSELASNIRIPNAYENAVQAYTNAIRFNPLNPTLYLNLANLQASQNKLDDALKTVGASLQVKNNYLDAIFLLSQITAAQGNLKDAIVAAQVGTQINSQSPVLFFQLGLLQYTNKDYGNAVKALESAVRLQSDYANAQYFLGLSYARIGDVSNAISQFENLAKTNSDNQEVTLILSNLMAGKSPFADAKLPVTPTPEKRSSLPIKEKKK